MIWSDVVLYPRLRTSFYPRTVLRNRLRNKIKTGIRSKYSLSPRFSTLLTWWSKALQCCCYKNLASKQSCSIPPPAAPRQVLTTLAPPAVALLPLHLDLVWSLNVYLRSWMFLAWLKLLACFLSFWEMKDVPETSPTFMMSRMPPGLPYLGSTYGGLEWEGPTELWVNHKRSSQRIKLSLRVVNGKVKLKGMDEFLVWIFWWEIMLLQKSQMEWKF